MEICSFEEKLVMTDYELIKAQIEDLKAKIEKNSISPLYMGTILDGLLGKLQSVDLHGISEKLYQQLVTAGYQGTEAEMYVALVAAIRRTIETDISSPARMEVEDSLDGFIGQGETDTVTCRVLKGYLDVTPLVERWKITREGGDEPSDAAWNASDKARNFSGTIDLTPGDFSIYRQSTIFRVTAEGSFSECAVAAEIVV